MNIKEYRDLAERVWSMEPPAKKEVALALLDACDRLEKIQQFLEIDMSDGMNVVSIAGDPLIADVVKAAWPSHAVGTPVLARAVEMLEDHPRLEHRLSDAMLQVKALLGENATHMKRVAKLEARLRPMDNLCIAASLGGHPNPLEHLDKFCNRCKLVGHAPDNCHFAAPEQDEEKQPNG